MGKRNALWIGGIALIAALGGVAAYAAFNPALLGSAGIAAPAGDPVRRASRIDGDMRATFERLEKSGERVEKPAPVEKAPRLETISPAPAEIAPLAVAAPSAPIAAAPAPGPVVLTKPAKGMPVSLVPGQQRAASSAEAPRVMDPRMTKALDLLANSAPRATVAALPDAAVPPPAMGGLEAPTVLRPPVGVVAVGVAVIAEKNEADMTAEELNAREHRRIRQALEGTAGGTN